MLTKEKEVKTTLNISNFIDIRKYIISPLDNLEKFLNEKDYDLDFWIKITEVMILSLGN